MTTSATETVRFDLDAALAATPAGVAAVAAALVVLLARPRRVSIPGGLPYVVLGCMWLYQLYRFSFL
jgi:hypothetical protein